MHLKLAVFFILLLCSSALSSCGSIAPTTTLPQQQITVPTHPFHSTTQTLDRDFTLVLDITPGHSGTNTFMLYVTDNHTHQPVTQVDITLYTTMQDMAMGTDSLPLHADGNGQFSATSEVLGMEGHWTIGITIQTTDQIIHKAGIQLDVPS